jgi:cytochrome c oxidase subunit I
MDMTYEYKQERRIALWFLLVALVALAVGSLPGIMQVLEHAGWFPVSAPLYYMGLALHGVFTSLVWVSFFASAFLMIAMTRSLGRRLAAPTLSWLALVLMVGGAALLAVGVFIGPTVMYTIDYPIRANLLFYVGYLLLIIGTWLHSINHFMTWSAWKRENPGLKTPLAAYGSLAAWILWDLATLGVIVELIVILLDRPMDALLARTLFWYFGNGLEYFALMPAYVSWLAMMPRQAGGKLYSERMARAVFVLFVVFAVPSGMVRQLTDGAFSPSLKALHVGLAFMAAIPGLLTAFNTMASLEYAGKSRGAGNIGWVFKLPFGDPSFTAQFLALTALALAGITGLVSISYTMALVVDNTTWETAHQHLAMAGAGTLTFMGISYWLVPYLTGRRLVSRALANLQALSWFLGVILLAVGLVIGSIIDTPIRTPLSLAELTWVGQMPFILAAAGGIILAMSAVLYFLIMLGSLIGQKDTISELDVPLADIVATPHSLADATDDRWRVWIGAALVLILLTYVPSIIGLMR